MARCMEAVTLSAYIHDVPRGVPSSAADGLNEGAIGAEVALLVGVEDGNQADLGQVQPLTQAG